MFQIYWKFHSMHIWFCNKVIKVAFLQVQYLNFFLDEVENLMCLLGKTFCCNGCYLKWNCFSYFSNTNFVPTHLRKNDSLHRLTNKALNLCWHNLCMGRTKRMWPNGTKYIFMQIKQIVFLVDHTFDLTEEEWLWYTFYKSKQYDKL